VLFAAPPPPPPPPALPLGRRSMEQSEPDPPDSPPSDWELHLDETYNAWFYYHPATDTSSWSRPEPGEPDNDEALQAQASGEEARVSDVDGNAERDDGRIFAELRREERGLRGAVWHDVQATRGISARGARRWTSRRGCKDRSSGARRSPRHLRSRGRRRRSSRTEDDYLSDAARQSPLRLRSRGARRRIPRSKHDDNDSGARHSPLPPWRRGTATCESLTRPSAAAAAELGGSPLPSHDSIVTSVQQASAPARPSAAPGIRVDEEDLVSIGSADHDSGTCRPCAWNCLLGGCKEGKNCNFCHLCTYDSLDKQQIIKVERFLAAASAGPGSVAEKCASASAAPKTPDGELAQRKPEVASSAAGSVTAGSALSVRRPRGSSGPGPRSAGESDASALAATKTTDGEPPRKKPRVASPGAGGLVAATALSEKIPRGGSPTAVCGAAADAGRPSGPLRPSSDILFWEMVEECSGLSASAPTDPISSEVASAASAPSGSASPCMMSGQGLDELLCKIARNGNIAHAMAPVPLQAALISMGANAVLGSPIEKRSDLLVGAMAALRNVEAVPEVQPRPPPSASSSLGLVSPIHRTGRPPERPCGAWRQPIVAPTGSMAGSPADVRPWRGKGIPLAQAQAGPPGRKTNRPAARTSQEDLAHLKQRFARPAAARAGLRPHTHLRPPMPRLRPPLAAPGGRAPATETLLSAMNVLRRSQGSSQQAVPQPAIPASLADALTKAVLGNPAGLGA